MDKEKKIKIDKNFLPVLHHLILDFSNTLIGKEIDSECRKFIKKLEQCNWKYNNQ